MKRLMTSILFLLLPVASHAALLKYELEFQPWSWPQELIDEGVYPAGTGHVIADTDLNAVVSGALNCDLFKFVWNNGSPTPMTMVDTYYGQHVVKAGSVQGTDTMNGVIGDLSLLFMLPPDTANYAAELHRHHFEDNWWELEFPDTGLPAEEWDHTYLGLVMTVHSPTPVPTPSAFGLLSLGLAVLVGGRFLKKRG